MQPTRIWQYVIGGALAVAALLIGGWGYLHLSIQDEVERFSAQAQRDFPTSGDEVEALLVYMQSGEHSLRARNLAVWTLGQLRDPRALPALEAAYTGGECNHDLHLCQRELKKAIDLCRGETPNFLLIRTPKARE
jgi:hypothetical protein